MSEVIFGETDLGEKSSAIDIRVITIIRNGNHGSNLTQPSLGLLLLSQE
jgi:hypothetical protein